MNQVAMSCPACGAGVKRRARECEFCGNTLLFLSMDRTFSRTADGTQLAEAIQKWRQKLQANPNDPEANYAIGVAYLNKGLRDAALGHLRSAALLAPESAEIHYNLALTLFNDGNILTTSSDYEEMQKEIGYACSLDPSFAEANAFKKFFAAKRLSGIDLNQSIKEYQAAIDSCPDISVFHNNLGQAYHLQKNYASAVKSFQKAIECEPNGPMAYTNLALTCYEGKYSGGVEAGEKAVALLTPKILPVTQAMCHNNYSMCLWRADRGQEAIEQVNIALSLVPGNPTFTANLAAFRANPNAHRAKPPPPGPWDGCLCVLSATLIFFFFVFFLGYLFAR